MDYSLQIKQVRALINDKEPYVFDYDHIELLVSMRPDNIYFVAGQLLTQVADDQALLYKYVKTDDILVDGTKVSAQLRLSANRYFDLADRQDAQNGVGCIDVAPLPNVWLGVDHGFEF